MQSLRRFVTLATLISFATGCASAPPMGTKWAQIAFAAGDKVEATRALTPSKKESPLAVFLTAKRLRLDSDQRGAGVDAAARISQATAAQAEAIVGRFPRLRRAAVYRLLQLGEHRRAAALAEDPILAALVAQTSGNSNGAVAHIKAAAAQSIPPLWAVRARQKLALLRRPAVNKTTEAAWRFLSVTRAPTKALEVLQDVPSEDCLAAITRGLAEEEIGRPVAAAAAFAAATCTDAQIHHVRLLARLKPAEARLRMERLLYQAPLNATLLRTVRAAHPRDSAQAQGALQRLVSWFPDDFAALRDQLTSLERGQRWTRANQLCDRALMLRYDDALHLLSLRYLALAGARSQGDARHRALSHRLQWLSQRRPDLAAVTELDRLIAGADEEGGALGAASLKLGVGATVTPAPGAAPTDSAPAH